MNDNEDIRRMLADIVSQTPQTRLRMCSDFLDITNNRRGRKLIIAVLETVIHDMRADKPLDISLILW